MGRLTVYLGVGFSVVLASALMWSPNVQGQNPVCESTKLAVQNFRVTQGQRQQELSLQLQQSASSLATLHRELQAREGQKVKDLSREKQVVGIIRQSLSETGERYFAMAEEDEALMQSWTSAFESCGWSDRKAALEEWWNLQYELITTLGAVVGQYGQQADWDRDWSELERGVTPIPAGQFDAVRVLQNDLRETGGLLPELFQHVDEALSAVIQ